MADLLKDSQTMYCEALDASRRQRQQIQEDLEFSDPSDPQQWDQTEKQARMTDPGGARPCLVMDQTEQYVANVAGQVEQRPPALHAIPVGGGADKKVAEQLDGFYRHIEHSSRAQQHYAIALTAAARAGVGYLMVLPEYVDRALNWQEPRITSEGDPLRVVFDPWSKELDGSDAEMGWHLAPMSYSAFEREFGKKSPKISFGDREGKTCDERESIITAVQWRVVTETKNIIVATLNGDEASYTEDEFHEARQNGQPLVYVRNYRDKRRVVKWARLSGAEVLTEEAVYPADGIGIVPVYGYVGWKDGRLSYCGIPRRAREPQRAYNYHMSEMRAYITQAPKSPLLVPMSALKDQTIKNLYDLASVQNRAYLPYNDWDAENGRVIAPPTRLSPSVDLRNHIEGAMQARQDIQAALGMYQASLGAPSNETSGIAIESRKQQGEAATAHFPSHLAASLGTVGKLCMQMIPRLIDTKRQVRIIGIDNTASATVIDPSQAQAMVETPQGVSINPNVGKYDVRIVVGASFSTQRQQAQEAYTEMMRANPQMMPAIAPLWAQTLDVPHADKLAQVLTAVAPDAVKAILQPDTQPGTAEVKAENDQLKQALQEATSIAREAQQDADEANDKLRDKQAENEIAQYNAETNRLKVTGANVEQIEVIVQQLLTQMLTGPAPLPGDQPAAPEEQMPIEAEPLPNPEPMGGGMAEPNAAMALELPE